MPPWRPFSQSPRKQSRSPSGGGMLWWRSARHREATTSEDEPAYDLSLTRARTGVAMLRGCGVTKAQHNAARILVARSEQTGKTVTSSVKKIAAADSPLALSSAANR